VKYISVAGLIFAAAVPGFCQAPHRSLSSLFNSKLAFYLPEPDSTPISSFVVNTAGGSPTIAPNTWLEIHGTQLAQTTMDWSNADFSHGLPISLGGVSATVNNKPAAIFYISPTQINVLAPIDSAAGPVPVMVTTPYGTTAPLNPTEQPISLGFLVFDAPNAHIVAQHLPSYTLLGPASLSVPGYTFTPAKPGEFVIFYATGFGQTNPPITDQLSGTGPLPTLPSVTIGGLPAEVKYAGLASPGLYQLNVIIPDAAPNGDLPVVATYNGATTQTGAVITVQQ
jgi:uncharacterized protein (TIGR03437 family)